MAIVQSFTATDPDAVADRLQNQYGTVALTGPETSMREDIFLTPEFFLDRMSVRGGFVVKAGAGGGRLADIPVLTTVISSGRYRWAVGDETGDGRTSPFLLRPGTTTLAECRDTTLLALGFGVSTLERAARDLYGDERLIVKFDSGAPVDRASGRYYRDLLLHVQRTLPLLADSALLRASLSRSVVAAVLECFVLHGEPAPRQDSVRSQQEGYRRARTYVADHAAEPITVNDIAAASSLSVAQLDRVIRADSPTGDDTAGELRRARIAGAHHDLLAADPTGGETVQGIAARWGFTPSNFARVYRRAYGRLPVESLRR